MTILFSPPQVCAINAVVIVLLAIAMPSGVIQRALSYCFLIWSSLVILAKMCYQLQFVQEDVFQHNCSNTVRYVAVKIGSVDIQSKLTSSLNVPMQFFTYVNFRCDYQWNVCRTELIYLVPREGWGGHILVLHMFIL